MKRQIVNEIKNAVKKHYGFLSLNNVSVMDTTYTAIVESNTKSLVFVALINGKMLFFDVENEEQITYEELCYIAGYIKGADL